MRILSRELRESVRVTGRLSDGSDRAETIAPEWVLVVVDDAGIRRTLVFDADPNDDDIAARIPEPEDVFPTRQPARIRKLAEVGTAYLTLRDMAADPAFSASARAKLAVMRNALQSRIEGWLT